MRTVSVRHSLSGPALLVHALVRAAVIFGLDQAALAVTLHVPALSPAPGTSTLLVVAVLRTVLAMLVVLALSAIDGWWLRTPRLGWVWALALVLTSVADGVATFRAVRSSDDLTGTATSELVASILPGLLTGQTVELVLLGVAAAGGIALGRRAVRRSALVG